MTPTHIELLFFGTELLTGKLNSHLAYFGEKFSGLGLIPARAQTIGDDLRESTAAVRESWKRSRLLITCGGLGPTFDDLTREALSGALRLPLVLSPKLLHGIEARFQKRGIRMPPDNRRQAYLLKGARVIENPNGTAPGQLLEKNGRLLLVLPGPGEEMRPMVEGLWPLLRKRLAPRFADSQILHTFGIPESLVAERIDRVIRKRRDPKANVVFGILAHQSIVDVKFSVTSGNPVSGKRVFQEILREFRACLGNDVYGRGDETLESTVGKLLERRRQTLAVAESCTGGLIGHKLTAVPGSSRYFQGGVTAYSNEVKKRFLGVRSQTLARHGAVSEPVAKEMALGARKRFGSAWALSSTGVAGPSGGSREKPTGLVCLAVAGPGGVAVETRRFHGNRSNNKERMALAGLDLLRRRLS